MYYAYFLGFYYSKIANTSHHSYMFSVVYNYLSDETYYLNLDNELLS